MAELRAEKRRNVKGHLVTKHVRAGAPESKTAAKLPQPKLTAATSKTAPADPMDVTFPFKGYGSTETRKLLNAAKEVYGIDSVPDTVDISSRQYYASQHANLSGFATRMFAVAGVTDPEEMAAFCLEHDKKHAPHAYPGIVSRRHRWTNNLLEEGVTYETLMKATKLYDGLRIDRLSSPDIDNANPADIVRAYAEYPTGRNRTAIIPFIWNGQITFDQVKTHGASRIAQNEDGIRLYVTDEEKKMPLEDYIAIVKKEEKMSSPLEKSTKIRAMHRARAAELWGMERAMSLRMPSVAFSHKDRSLDSVTDPDKAFRVLKFHEEVQHLAILRESVNSSYCEEKEFAHSKLSSIKGYESVSGFQFYRPSIARTESYFKLGMTPEDTIIALELGKEPIEYLAKKEGGIVDSLTDGWL